MAGQGKMVCSLLLDVHDSMGEAGLCLAKECLSYWYRGRLIQKGKKDGALVLVGSDVTHNDMAEDETMSGYDNICVSRKLLNADLTVCQEIEKAALGGSGGDRTSLSRLLLCLPRHHQRQQPPSCVRGGGGFL